MFHKENGRWAHILSPLHWCHMTWEASNFTRQYSVWLMDGLAWHGKVFHNTGTLCGESTSDWSIDAQWLVDSPQKGKIAPHDYPYHRPVHIRSQVKTRQSQNYKFKEFAKASKLKKLKKHVTHLLKLLDKMCKYEMALVSRRYRVDTILSTDRQTDKVITAGW